MEEATSITELTIPNTVNSIGTNAFAGLGESNHEVIVKVVKGSVADGWIANMDSSKYGVSNINVQYITE